MRFSRASKGAASAEHERIIFVEGQDDAYFIDKILDEIGASPDNIGVIYVEGESRLEPELGLLLKTSAYVRREIKRIAIIRDSDDDPLKKYNEIESYLKSLNLPQPKHGAVTPYDNDRLFGLYLMPHNGQKGALEELLLRTVNTDNRLTIVSNALKAVEAQSGSLDHASKRIMRMYVSVLPIDPCGAGRAYREGVFDSTHAWVEDVRQFLKLFLA